MRGGRGKREKEEEQGEEQGEEEKPKRACITAVCDIVLYLSDVKLLGKCLVGITPLPVVQRTPSGSATLWPEGAHTTCG